MKKLFLIAVLIAFQLPAMAQTTLPAFWSFVTPSPTEDSTNCPVGWKTRLNLTVSGTTPYVYATGSDGSASCRLDGQGEYVQIWFAEKPGTLSYYIKGTGITTPYFAGSFKTQESIDGNNWTDMRTFTTMTNAFVRYTESPASTSRYVRFFYDTKVSGSNVALDSVYLAKAPATTGAAINLKRNGSAIVNGSTQVMGNITSANFTIKNEGTVQALNISNYQLNGPDSADFSISNMPSSIAANDSAVFTVNFSLSHAGSRFANLTINSNSSDNGVFAIKFYGVAGNYATRPTAQPTGLSFTNLKSYTLNVGFTDPIPKPEFYIVLRKTNSAITDVPLNGHTYQRGDYIGSSQVAYIGSSSSFKPAYILAGTAYYFSVFAFNGPAGFENYLITNPLTGLTTTPNGNPGTYYSGINPGSTNFITMLSAKINVHDTIFYGNYTSTMINNFTTRDTTAGRKVVNCVYTSNAYIYEEPFVWWGNTGGGTLTREHTYAQSWMPSSTISGFPTVNGKELPEYNDQHHLFPADQIQANGLRSNNPFGDVVTITTQNGDCKLGKDSAGKTVFEPRASQKGDVARALFYMCTMYNGVGGRNWGFSNAIGAKQTEAILKKWNQLDPPDAYEIARNEYLASTQKNRNPFIDHPDWANRINFNTMVYIPIDTTAPKNPSVIIFKPIASDIWVKNNNAVVSWDAVDIDSLEILFSEDSLKTTTVLIASVAASLDSVVFPVTKVYSHPYGIVIIKDRKSAAADTSAYFKLSPVDGVNTYNKLNDISIYPNPAKDVLFIKTNEAGSKMSYLIYDIIGAKVSEGEFVSEAVLNINELHSGYYLVQVKNDKAFVNRIFIKQ